MGKTGGRKREQPSFCPFLPLAVVIFCSWHACFPNTFVEIEPSAVSWKLRLHGCHGNASCSFQHSKARAAMGPTRRGWDFESHTHVGPFLVSLNTSLFQNLPHHCLVFLETNFWPSAKSWHYAEAPFWVQMSAVALAKHPCGTGDLLSDGNVVNSEPSPVAALEMLAASPALPSYISSVIITRNVLFVLELIIMMCFLIYFSADIQT